LFFFGGERFFFLQIAATWGCSVSLFFSSPFSVAGEEGGIVELAESEFLLMLLESVIFFSSSGSSQVSSEIFSTTTQSSS